LEELDPDRMGPAVGYTQDRWETKNRDEAKGRVMRSTRTSAKLLGVPPAS
jgi:hypothetical protein